MPRRSILSTAERESLLALPDAKDDLIRYYTFSEALLHKSAVGRTTPIPRRTYPMRTVCGVPSAVKRFKIAAQI